MTSAGGGHTIELAPDGTIVGLVGHGNGKQLYRAFADGTLDLGFGTSGLLDLPNDADDYTNVAVTPDGKILVIGVTEDGAWLIRRFDADGATDATFGTGGEVVTDPSAGFDYAYNLTVLADGRFVVTGTVSPDVALARYAADGTLDASFGVAGVAIHDFGGDGEFLGRVEERPDGKLVAGLASSFGSAMGAFGIVRFEEDGAPDATFGVSGPGYTKVTPPGGAFGTSIALQPDGKILLTGHDDFFDPSARSFTVLRFLEGGALDPDFGTGGIATVAFLAAAQDESRMLRLLPDGRIMVVGQAEISPDNYQIMVARFLADGSLDGTFAALGAAAMPVDDFSQPVDTVLLPDGDLLLSGSSFPGGVRNFTMRVMMCGGCDVAVPGGCVTTPPPGGCRAAGSSTLALRRTVDGARDLLSWKYKKGPATAGADFGDPPAGDDLQLCFWFQSSIDGIIPLQRTTLLGGGTCGAKPCWKGLGAPAGAKGHRLRDRTLANDGMVSAALKSSTEARTTLTLKAKGPRIRHPAMPLGPDVKVRLQSSTGECWEATFPTATLDTPAQYKARTP
jgi:uncharacterized delta-60 repeat protein